LLAQEDCAARKLVKNETQDEAELGQPKQDSEEGLVDGEVDGENDEGKDSDDDDKSEEDSEGRRNKASGPDFWGGKTYAEKRDENIAENRKLLDALNAKYPTAVLKPKKAWTGARKNKGRDNSLTNITPAGTSQTATDLVPASPALAVPPNVPIATKAPSNSVTVVQGSSPADINNSETPATGQTATDLLPASPALAVPPNVPITTEATSNSVTVVQGSSPADINNSETPATSQTAIDLPASPALAVLPITKEMQNSSTADINNSETPTSTSHCISGEDHTIISQIANDSINLPTLSTLSGSHTPASFNINAEPSPLAESVDTDVVMRDTASSSGTQNDKNLPAWLTQMIVYLRQVSEAPAWHDLVSGFIEFENCGPPHGVSSCWILMGTD
jgi:hypothetical protein